MGIAAQIVPLTEEQELGKDPEVHLVPEFPVVPLHCLGFVETDILLRPLRPAHHAEMDLHGHEQGVILQPTPVLLAESRHLVAQLLPAPGKCPAQHGKAAGIDLTIVHPLLILAPVHVPEFGALQQAVPHQQIQIDEIRIPGKGGKG